MTAGRSLIQATTGTRLSAWDQPEPIASIRWFDQSHLLITDLATNLWRANLDKKLQPAFCVSSPALSAELRIDCKQ